MTYNVRSLQNIAIVNFSLKNVTALLLIQQKNYICNWTWTEGTVESVHKLLPP